MKALLLLCLCLTGCTGWLVDSLEQRQMQSCWWIRGPLGGGYGVTATGGVSVATCLSVQCPCSLAR
jgi:pantoate kinase